MAVTCVVVGLYRILAIRVAMLAAVTIGHVTSYLGRGNTYTIT